MKYFKPALLASFRSPDDDIADAAAIAWDRATASYKTRLDAIRAELPKGARTIIRHFSLHDAKLLGFAQAKRAPWLILMIELENSKEQFQIKYAVTPKIRSLKVVPPKLSVSDRGPSRILYDEFDKVTGGPENVFSHSLLLSDGQELQIRFTNLHVQQLKQLVLPSMSDADLQAAS